MEAKIKMDTLMAVEIPTPKKLDWGRILIPAKQEQEAGDYDKSIWGIPRWWRKRMYEWECWEVNLRYSSSRADVSPDESVGSDEDHDDELVLEHRRAARARARAAAAAAPGAGEGKRIKLSAVSTPTSSSSASDYAKSKLCYVDALPRVFLFNLTINIPDWVSLEDNNAPQLILNSMMMNNNPLPIPAESALQTIEHKILFTRRFLAIQAHLFATVKLLYQHVPNHLPSRHVFQHVKAMAGRKYPPFAHLRLTDDVARLRVTDDDNDNHMLRQAIQIYTSLLGDAECLFHPLMRKSYEKEFFSIVDKHAKLEERKFVMARWRNSNPIVPVGLMLKLSLGISGLRDEKYQYCCSQIRLQELFDDYLYHCPNVKHDSIVEFLLCDDTVVPSKFEHLDPELKLLSLQACIKTRNLHQECKRCCTQLKLLENAHRDNGTADIDKMLIDLHSKFPDIFSLSLDSPVDNALEEGLKDATYKMKDLWFSGIAEYRVLELTLLYMKHLVSKSETEVPDWSTRICRYMKYFRLGQKELYHEHPMYDHVMNVEFRLA